MQWIRRFIIFHYKRHPQEMGVEEINQFLSDLAVTRRVAASTQNQALSAVLFLYQVVLHQDLGRIEDIVHAQKLISPQRGVTLGIRTHPAVPRAWGGRRGVPRPTARLSRLPTTARPPLATPSRCDPWPLALGMTRRRRWRRGGEASHRCCATCVARMPCTTFCRPAALQVSGATRRTSARPSAGLRGTAWRRCRHRRRCTADSTRAAMQPCGLGFGRLLEPIVDRMSSALIGRTPRLRSGHPPNLRHGPEPWE